MNSPRLLRAFTLIEILVVVSIIGIVLSIAVLSLGILGDDRELREEARRFTALVQVVQDEDQRRGVCGSEFVDQAHQQLFHTPGSGLGRGGHRGGFGAA